VLAAVLDQVGGPIAQVNFLVAWSAPMALGFCWADGLLEGRAVRRLLPLAGLALLVLAVAMFGYPASMVGVPGALRSNNSPPTVALVFLGWLQAGAVLAAREPVTRWLRRARVWSVVVRLNLVAMTVYLWHLTVMVVSVVLLHAVGLLPDSPGLGLGFWATRPLWLAGLTVGLAPVVALLARVELTTPKPRGGRGGVPAVVATAAASAALCALLVLGAAGSATGLALAAVLTGSAIVLGAFRPRHA
jgi:hypothetical protein